MANLFISYSRKDSAFADRLYQRLQQAGHTVWMDRKSLAGGQEWVKELEKNIPEADAVILLWSQQAASSDWVRREIEFADSQKKPIIPVTIDGTLPTDNIILQGKQVIRAQGRFNEAVLEINAALRIYIEVVVGSPPPPYNPSGWRQVLSGLPVWSEVLIGLMALVLAFLALFPQESRDDLLHRLGLLGSSATPTVQIAVNPTLTPTTPPTTATETASPTPVSATTSVTDTPTATTPVAMPPSDSPVTFEAINAWWQANGYGTLTINATLQDLAVRRERQLRSRPLTQLGNIELDDQGQTIEQSARVNGYTGAVMIAAYAAPRTPTLADITDQIAVKIDAASRANYPEAGFSAYTNTVTGYTYVVLILGAGGG